MPRSGTTLVERILTGSSQVESAGELNSLNLAIASNLSQHGLPHLSPGYINKISELNLDLLRRSYFNSAKPLIKGDSEYFIDKMPLNFMYIELIARAFPESKIVLLHRHPLDLCIGNFKVLFSTRYSLYNYALDLQNTASYIAAFTSLMKHYKNKLKHRLHIVDFERLAGDPKHEGKKIFDYCGLKWSDEYIEIQNNQSAVTTASSVQVRQSINTRSINRWRLYRDNMQEVCQSFIADGIIDSNLEKRPL